MNKRIMLIHLLLIASVILCGCTNNAESDNSSESKASEKLTSAPDNSEADIESFGFFAAMNLCKLNSENSTGEPLGFKYEIADGLVSIVLETTVSPDSSIQADKLPVRVWLICDNELLPFSLDGGEFKETNEYDENEGYSHIISFNGNKDMRFVTVVISALPDHIPELKLGLYTGICTYTFVNTSSNSLDIIPDTIDENNYLMTPAIIRRGCFDFDKSSLENDSDTHFQFYEDFILKENDNMYIKFNRDQVNDEQEPLGIYYSLFIICDGEIIPVFNGNKTIIVHTPFTSEINAYDKTFEYAIPSTFLKSKGMHILQAVAVPYYIPDALDNIKNNTSYGYNGSSTNKTRVVTE